MKTSSKIALMLSAAIISLIPFLMELPASAAPMSAHGGGCNLSMNGQMNVCISEDSSHYIIADVYLYIPYQDCNIRLGIIDGNNEVKATQFPCDGLTGDVYAIAIPATAGHVYIADALFVSPVYDFGESPPQYA